MLTGPYKPLKAAFKPRLPPGSVYITSTHSASSILRFFILSSASYYSGILKHFLSRDTFRKGSS